MSMYRICIVYFIFIFYIYTLGIYIANTHLGLHFIQNMYLICCVYFYPRNFTVIVVVFSA